jgi:HPt (histidine-containing phosphotransfer) domain-containing protein
MSAKQYNLDYLKQVFQGNEAMVLRILDIFEVEVPRYFAAMARLGQEDKWSELHPLAHKAKSSVGMLGMQPLLEDVLAIEQASRSGGSADILAPLLERAALRLESALQALRADRERQGLHQARASVEADTERLRPSRRLHRRA